MTHEQSEISKALRQNLFIHKYVMALDHALLWVAALSLAAYFHVSKSYTPHEALLFSTLSAYCAYICESGLNTLRVAASSSAFSLDFRKAAMWHWIGLNVAVNTILSILFLEYPNWIFLTMVILTAGWQKYMDGRIPPRLIATRKPLNINYQNKKS